MKSSSCFSTYLLISLTPVTALALSVPSFLLGSAGKTSVSCRALGGIVGVTLFIAIYDNKMSVALPADVSAIVFGQGYSPSVFGEVMSALATEDLSVLFALPYPMSLLGAVNGALTAAEVYSWRYVWIAIACVVAGGALASCALKSVRKHMND